MRVRDAYVAAPAVANAATIEAAAAMSAVWAPALKAASMVGKTLTAAPVGCQATLSIRASEAERRRRTSPPLSLSYWSDEEAGWNVLRPICVPFHVPLRPVCVPQTAEQPRTPTNPGRRKPQFSGSFARVR